jgi:peptidoglycan/xylan/chitin deacetylase (PgdA/CDA1 family)
VASWARLDRAVLAHHRRATRPSWLTVLNYHRVASPSAVAETDTGVQDATPASFEGHLRLVREHFNPIALGDLLAHLEGGPLPPNPLLVTFDDGYRDNVDEALPILQRHGMRATFFIATHYVGGRRLYWWDRISWIVKHARRPRLLVPGLGPLEVDGENRSAVERRLHDLVKKRPALDIEGFLDELAEAADAPWTPAIEDDLVARHVMTWDDVRTLLRAGMDVGSHTRTHRVLQTVPPDQLEDELSGSRADLEAALGIEIRTIAYPVGRPVSRDPVIRPALEAAGYRLGFTYDTGRQHLRGLDPFDVRRFAVERSDTDQQFLVRIALPRILP